MLYEQWRRTVEREGGRWAVCELESGRRWSFRELEAAQAALGAPTAPIVYPRGGGVEFLLRVIQGWRHGCVVCPLEPGQEPLISEPLPEGWEHLKTTSATTGRARFIGFGGRELAADAENIVLTMGLRAGWPNLGVISLGHSYGFSNLVLPLLLHGIPLILSKSALPGIIRSAVEAFGPVTLPAVPALWRAWHEAGCIGSGVALAISAGAMLPLDLERGMFETAGVKIHNFYGASECGGIAYDSTDAPREKETCVGRPLRNVEVSVAGDGCLSVRSGAVGLGYWPEPAPTLGGGRYQTSDLAELRDGEVHLLGRASDIINVAGRKVVPESIERALLEHRCVRACLVFGAPLRAGGRGEEIVVVLGMRTPSSRDELRRFLLERLPAWQIPRIWYVAEDLAVNQRGKMPRATWRARHLAADPALRRLE